MPGRKRPKPYTTNGSRRSSPCYKRSNQKWKEGEKTKDQAEKNKAILLGEIEKHSGKPITSAAARYLAECRGAYKAICMMEKHHEAEKKDEAGREDEMSSRQIKRWMETLENEDGTHGPHYTKDQVEQYRRSLGITCDLMELFAATNMMYSDYCRVLKKYGADRMEVYVELAQAFLDDKDAGAENKLEAYYKCIVEGQ